MPVTARRALLGGLVFLAACQTPEATEPGDTEREPVVALPFSSISVSGLKANWVDRESSNSPYLQPSSQQHSTDTYGSVMNYPDQGFLTGNGFLGVGSIDCMEDGVSSDVLVMYEVGRRKSDRFACRAEHTSKSYESYQVGYDSRADFDGALLSLSGRMSAVGTNTYEDRRTNVKAVHEENVRIRIAEGKCEVVSWQAHDKADETTAETSQHYASESHETQDVVMTPKTRCMLTR